MQAKKIKDSIYAGDFTDGVLCSRQRETGGDEQMPINILIRKKLTLCSLSIILYHINRLPVKRWR